MSGISFRDWLRTYVPIMGGDDPPGGGGDPQPPAGDPPAPAGGGGDPDPQPAPTPPAPTDDPADLGEAGRKALDAERRARRDAEKRAKDLEGKVREFEDRDKTELERVTGERDIAKTDREKLATENLRLKVAMAKKLPPELADRLQGSTQEEMEADADKLLGLVKQTGGGGFDGGPRPSGDPEPSPGLARLAHAYSQSSSK